MKKLILLFLLINSIGLKSQNLTLKIDSFYSKVIDENSNFVKYNLVKKNQESLQSIISEIEAIEWENQGVNFKSSSWINLYNLHVINKIAKKYPIESVTNLPDFFDDPFVKLGTRKLSLNELESEIRFNANDARIHFALVCGAKSCPPLFNKAFTEENFNSQLDFISKFALKKEHVIKLDEESNSLYLNQIFNWYAEDFGEKENLIPFLKYYLPELNNDLNIEFFEYDWSLNDASEVKKNDNNLQLQTPSMLFSKGSVEFKSFWNLYSQTKGFDNNGSKVNYGARSSYLTSLNSLMVGVTPKLNLGAEIWLSSVNVGQIENSIFLPYQFSNTNNSRFTVSYFGPKAKLQPFNKFKNISIQTSFLMPIGNDLDGSESGKPYLAADRFLWLTQFFWDQPLNNKWQLFFQVAPWVSINRDFNFSQNTIETPASIFLSYFATSRLSFYAQQEFWPKWGNNIIDAYFRQEGVGLKYQLIPQKLEFETSSTLFTSGKNQGAGFTLNFGVRIVNFK